MDFEEKRIVKKQMQFMADTKLTEFVSHVDC